jgi:hypothetical protein
MEQLAVFIVIAVVFGVINTVVEKVQAAKRAIQVEAERERQRRLREAMGTEAPDYSKPFAESTMQVTLGAPGETGRATQGRRSGGVLLERAEAIRTAAPRTPGGGDASPAARWKQLLEEAVESASAANERAASAGEEMDRSGRGEGAREGGWHADFDETSRADSGWRTAQAEMAEQYGDDLEPDTDQGYDFGGQDGLAGGEGHNRAWSGDWREDARPAAGEAHPVGGGSPVVGVAMGNAIGDAGDSISGVEDEDEPILGSAAATVTRRRRTGAGRSRSRLGRIVSGERGGGMLRTLIVSEVVLRPKWND